MNNLIEFAKEQCEIFPEDSEMGKYLRETMKMLQAEFCTLDDAREDFVFDVYNILDFLPTNNEANQIIDVFDRVTSGLEQESPLDKIRAEIVDLADEPTYGDYQYGFSYGLMRAAQIIDKYKAGEEYEVN